MRSFCAARTRARHTQGAKALCASLALVVPAQAHAWPWPTGQSVEEAAQAQNQLSSPPPSTPIGMGEHDALLAAGAAEAARHSEPLPIVSELSRHVQRLTDDFWWNGADGVPLGRIRRHSWRQWFRTRFDFASNDGHNVCAGTQPWSQVGVWSKSLSVLHIDAPQGRLATLRGRFFTTARAKFSLDDPNGEPIAVAWLDNQSQSVAWTAPDNDAHRIASFNRERPVDDAPDRWRVIVSEPAGLPPCAWGILASFFARYYQP